MNCYSSVTIPVSPKNPISREKLKITSTKIQISIKKKFLSDLVFKKNDIRFWKEFPDKSAQTDCFKEIWVLILKGLKHLKTVINR